MSLNTLKPVFLLLVNEVVFLLSVRHPTLSDKSFFVVRPPTNTLPFYERIGTTENLFVLAIIETDQWNLIVWVTTSCLQTSEKKGGIKTVIPYE